MERRPEKLLQSLRQSAGGRSPNEVRKMLEGNGFRVREGRRHIICQHRVYLDIVTTIPRHDPVKKWVVSDAIKAVDEARERSAKP
jgi:hypothetical protein